MPLKDLMNRAKGLFSRVAADVSHRPDGGTSHYRPLRNRTADTRPGEMTQNAGQNPPYIHTGFTGMNPPADYGGYDQRTAFGQASGGQTGYFQTREQPQPSPSYVGQGSFSGGNISYMPGVEPGLDRGRVHVEHIIALTGLKSCYEAIECMKDGETLIVALDAIANESESIRCQDMLAGAAFTLGCSVRLLNGARIVVIAPEGVKILPEQPAGEPMLQPEAAPVRMAAPVQNPQPERRERRTGPNAREWNAARNGELEGYNPYTGTMPVAAGAYASFGGYGM